jgi:hypothetical protein
VPTQAREQRPVIGPAESGRHYMVKITDYKTHKKPISKEDQEVFNWIGQQLQDVYDGKNVYLSDESVEKDKQAWLKTQITTEEIK